MIALAPLVAAAASGDTITLDAGEYDDTDPVVIDSKRLQITGPREAIVHSEFALYSSFLRFDGFTMEMNKVGAPSKTGIVFPFAQNGMVTANNSHFWSDDILWRSWRPPNWEALGYPVQFNKCAYQGIGGFARFWARTKGSPIDWRGNNASVIQQFYGGVLYLYGKDGTTTLGIQPGTALGDAAVFIENAQLVMSGLTLYDNGQCIHGIRYLRGSYIQVGSGFGVSIQKPIPYDGDLSSYLFSPPNAFIWGPIA